MVYPLVMILCLMHFHLKINHATANDIFTRFEELNNCTCHEADIVFSLYSESIVRCGLSCEVYSRCDGFIYNGIDKLCLGCQSIYETGQTQVTELENKCFEEEWFIFGQFQFKISISRMSFTQGVNYCRAIGGYMAKLDSFEKNEFIRVRAQQLKMNIWIGLTDKDQEGVWVWESDGEPVNFTSWYTAEIQGQPDGNETANCVHLAKGYRSHRNDNICGWKLNVLCEKEVI